MRWLLKNHLNHNLIHNHNRLNTVYADLAEG